jgi:anti-anti-sigma factor
VTGELDVANVQTLERCVSEACEADALVIDLSGLSFIDARGVRALARCCEIAAARDTHVAVVSPRPPADRALRLTGASTRLPLAATLVHALRAVSGETSSRFPRRPAARPQPR